MMMMTMLVRVRSGDVGRMRMRGHSLQYVCEVIIKVNEFYTPAAAAAAAAASAVNGFACVRAGACACSMCLRRFSSSNRFAGHCEYFTRRALPQPDTLTY